MLQKTSPQVRKIVIGVVLVAAVLMIAVVPFMAFNMVNPILELQLERIAQFQADGNAKWHLLTLTTWLVSFFYPFWATLSALAGVALFVIAKPLFKGEGWARGLALICLAMPSIGGAYMIVPWMNFVGSKEGGFPPAVFIMVVGLIPYFAILLAEKVDFKQKLVDFFVFLMLGVTSAESFANGHAAFRVLYGHPKRPMFAEGISITYFGWVGLWVAWILLTIAIYKLGTRKESGWYLMLIGGAIAMLVGGATHYVRHATVDYLLNSAMGLSLVVMALIPLVKERLLTKYTE
ncbi:MAG: hypothetical protein DRI56_03775 [Chloroflexota bacterium]|nr:MAG: hypothetical protein DRI56_03775 [Chloroflexota bacterium]